MAIKKLGFAVAIGLGILYAIALSPVARGDQPFVDPYDATSPSGDWVLHVEPSDPDGEGPATYRMTHKGELAWEATLEYTLRECVVGSSGVTVGYAYDAGYMGWGGVSTDSLLIVASIHADGQVAHVERHKRQITGFSGSSPMEPRCVGMMLDDVNERAILRINRDFWRPEPQPWWIFSMDTGERVATQFVEPKLVEADHFASMKKAAVVPGTPFVAAYWRTQTSESMADIIGLVDSAGQVVWCKRFDPLPIDWHATTLPLSPMQRDRIRVLEVGDASFMFTSFADLQPHHYSVAADGAGGWIVTEDDVDPAQPHWMPDADGDLLVLSPSKLELIRTVRVQTPESKGIIQGVFQMDMDDSGRLGWVRGVGGEKRTQRFALVDREGVTIADYLLDVEGANSLGLMRATWLEGNTWIITQPFANGESDLAAWFIDASSGVLTPVEAFYGSSVKRVRRMPLEGGTGFVVLGKLRGRYTQGDQLMFYDRDGRPAAVPHGWGLNEFQAIEDIAVLGEGTLAILADPSSEPRVLLYRPSSKTPFEVDLKLYQGDGDGGRGYFSAIHADKSGGFLVYDSANQDLLRGFSTAGTLRSSFRVQDPSGARFSVGDRMVLDPDGRLWTSDGSRILRIDGKGIVDFVIGGPEEGAMGRSCALTMDDRGWINVLEGITSRVHVFDETGEPVRVMRPRSWEVYTQDASAWIRVEADGSILACMGFTAPVIAFMADGTPVAGPRVRDTWRGYEDIWREIPGGGWETNGRSFRRVAAEGAEPVVVRHRPDGAWLVNIEHASAAPDGSLGVICDRVDPSDSFARLRGDAMQWLCAYGPDGDPRSMTRIQTPFLFDRLAYDGERAYLSDSGGVTVVPIPMTGEGTRFDYGDDEHVWDTMLRPDGTLATWQNGSREVQFWKLPE